MTRLRTSFLHLSFLLLTLCVFFHSCKSPNASNTAQHPAADSLGFSPPANDPFTKNGEEKDRYPNGALQMQGNYVNGKRDGNWFSWYNNGKPWSETSFDNGIKNGPTKTWYENGQLRYTGQYKNDQKTGIWNFYEESGKQVKQIDYDKNGNSKSSE
jgi:hypothetical protein